MNRRRAFLERWGVRLRGGFDRVLDLVEDAFLVLKRNREIRSEVEHAIASASPATVFLARLPFRTNDPLLARRLASRQLSRHAPTSPESLHWTVLPSEELGRWCLTFRKDEPDFETAMPADVQSVWRTGAALAARRKSWMLWLGAAALTLVSVSLLAQSLAWRSEAELDLARRTERDVLAEVGALQQSRSGQDPASSEVSGWSVSRYAELESLVAEILPADWSLLALNLSDARFELAALAPAEDRSAEREISEALRAELGSEAVAVSRSAFRPAGVEVRFTVVLPVQAGTP